MKVLAGPRRGAPESSRPRPEQRDGPAPHSLVLKLQRSAGNRAVTGLLARGGLLQRSPTLKGGPKLDSPADVAKHAPDAHKAYMEYCATKLVGEQAIQMWAEDAAYAYLGEVDAEVTSEELLSALKHRFDEMLVDIPADQKASAQTPAAAQKPQRPLPYGTGPPAQPPTRPGPIAERPAPWGIVWLIWPGIGVEDPKGDRTYAQFLRDQLEIIATTLVGASLLAEFDPASGSRFRMLAPVGKEKEDPYAGITALIGEPMGEMKEIRTIDVGELKGPEGKRENNEPLKIPRISFFSRPAEKQEKLIGKGPSKVVDSGLASHLDFPNTVEPFDVILFHEFGHAFLSQTGYTKVLTDELEEKVVVGLLEAKGVVSGENAYRCEKGRGLRTSYLTSGHQPDPALAPAKNPQSFWRDQRASVRQAIAAVLHVTEEEVDKRMAQ